MCEVDDFYSKVNSIDNFYSKVNSIGLGNPFYKVGKDYLDQDKQDQEEIQELERLRKAVARKRRREEIERLKRELNDDCTTICFFVTDRIG